jgi:hypothetical protein
LVCDVCGGDPNCAKFCAPQALKVGGKQKLADEKKADYSKGQIDKIKEDVMK